MNNHDDSPLPDGWIREFDPKSKHPFWVDTLAKPPRSIWVHPYEDEQFLSEHSDIREQLAKESTPELPPPYTSRRHSFSGAPSTSTSTSATASHLAPPQSNAAIRTSLSHPGTPVGSQNHRGFFGKLKDKAIGTKEEREARHRAEQEANKRYMEERQKRQRAYASSIGGLGPRYGESSFGQSAYGTGYTQPMYAAPAGNPFGLGGRRTRLGGGGFGAGGLGVPLLAGAAGGLLLGDIFDGGFGGGGFDNDFGGGFDNNFGGGFF